MDKINRRNFLIGSGLAVLAVAGGLTYCAFSSKTAYDSLYNVVSEVNRGNVYGSIGRTNKGRKDTAVLAIHQIHGPSTQELRERVDRDLQENYKHKEDLEGILKKEISKDLRRQVLETLDLANLAISEYKEGLVLSTSDSQRNIYLLLNGVSEKIQIPLVVGSEGLIALKEYDSLISSIQFDRDGMPNVDDVTDYFYKTFGWQVLKERQPKTIVVGLEDKSINDEIVLLAKKKGYMDSQRFKELQVLRNAFAVASMCMELQTRSLPFGVFIYGSAHFKEHQPTIPDILERKGQSYIEFIPKALSEKK